MKTYTCPGCKQTIEYDDNADLYSVVADHLESCPKPLRMVPAIYEAATGQLAESRLRYLASRYAQSVGLKPELGHICLYHGRPWVTIEGWYYRFRQKYPSGQLTTRPLNELERQSLFLDGCIQAWLAEAYDVPEGHRLSMGYGYASSGDEPLAKGSAVEGKWPWRLAEKRAEEDCLQKAVPLDIIDKPVQ